MLSPFKKIVIDKEAEAGYRRRALKAYPVEYIEALWGYVRGDVLYVCAFVNMKHTSNTTQCDYEDEELDDHEDQAKEEKLELLGTIHSHPWRKAVSLNNPNDIVDEAFFSQSDLVGSQDSQESVIAICSITKFKGRGEPRKRCIMRYWPAVRPLEIVYKDWHEKSATEKRSAAKSR